MRAQEYERTKEINMLEISKKCPLNFNNPYGRAEALVYDIMVSILQKRAECRAKKFKSFGEWMKRGGDEY